MENKEITQQAPIIPVIPTVAPTSSLEEEKVSILSSNSIFGRIFYIFSVFTVLLAIVTLIVGIIWITQPTNVLVIKNAPVSVEKKVIGSGEVQILNIDYCKNSDVQGIVSWQLVSHRVVVSLPSYTDLTKTSCQQIRFPMILPFIAHTDTYYIHWHIVYQINPLKTSTLDFDSQPFTISSKS